jgi:hypothetical protein
MTKVMIATLAYDHRVDAHYHHSVINTIRVCAEHGVQVVPITWPGEAIIQHGRNALVEIAMSDPALTAVLFIDSDQEWEPLQALKLLRYNVDVVGAPVRKKTDDEELYNVLSLRGADFRLDPRTNLAMVESVGTGFLKVSAGALREVWGQSEPYEYGGKPFRKVFDIQTPDGQMVGEDVLFCAKLADAGYQVYLDTSFTVGHNGYKRYQGDFQAYIQRRKTNGELVEAGR